MKLIVGLGNPGEKYQHTRHNVGFRIVERLAEKMKAGAWKNSEKFEGLVAEADKVCFLKPMTFMNLSGKSVSALLRFYKFDPSKDLLIVTDDKDMIFGKLRERSEGSSGGHNGLKSIVESLGSENFHRLKFGVGHDDQKIPTDAFVLQNFSAEEEGQLPKLVDEALKKIEQWLGK